MLSRQANPLMGTYAVSYRSLGRTVHLSRPGPYQEEHIVTKFRAQGLQTGHAAYRVLRGPVQDEPCAALLAVLEYEDDSLQQLKRLSCEQSCTVLPPGGSIHDYMN